MQLVHLSSRFVSNADFSLWFFFSASSEVSACARFFVCLLKFEAAFLNYEMRKKTRGSLKITSEVAYFIQIIGSVILLDDAKKLIASRLTRDFDRLRMSRLYIVFDRITCGFIDSTWW